MTDAIRDMSFRHPGLDIPGVHFDSHSIGTRVKGVHWLNFLGAPVLGELGAPRACARACARPVPPCRSSTASGRW